MAHDVAMSSAILLLHEVTQEHLSHVGVLFKHEERQLNAEGFERCEKLIAGLHASAHSQLCMYHSLQLETREGTAWTSALYGKLI